MISIEEKAKRYDEAINRIKHYVVDEYGCSRIKVADVFPELAESEDEQIRKAIIYHIQHCDDTIDEQTEKRMLAWLKKQGEQKPAWNEEDEDYYDAIIAKLEITQDDASLTDNQMEFLKSLKDRVQPKQEWSGEDMLYLEQTLQYLKVAAMRNTDPKRVDKCKDWLKSLRPQNWTKEDKERYISCLQRLSTGNPEQPETVNSKWFKEHVYPQNTWKPSDEQMVAIDTAINVLGKGTLNGKHLIELQEQLKKLKE